MEMPREGVKGKARVAAQQFLIKERVLGPSELQREDFRSLVHRFADIADLPYQDVRARAKPPDNLKDPKTLCVVPGPSWCVRASARSRRHCQPALLGRARVCFSLNSSDLFPAQLLDSCLLRLLHTGASSLAQCS